MIQVYESGVEVVATVDLQDLNYNLVVDPDSASFRVLDVDGEEISTWVSINLVGGETQLTQTISAINNTLGLAVQRGYRVVEFKFVKGGNTYQQNFEYILQGQALLLVGTNSYQTYARAIIVSMDLADTDFFKAGTREAQIASLADAYQSIGAMSFEINGIVLPPLTKLTKTEFEGLDQRFVSAIRRAQVIESNETMNPGSIHRKRVAGILAESIGESSMMFRPEKVMNNQPLTRRSMILLTEWLNWTLKTGRA